MDGPKCQVQGLGFYTVGREKPLEFFLFVCLVLFLYSFGRGFDICKAAFGRRSLASVGRLD